MIVFEKKTGWTLTGDSKVGEFKFKVIVNKPSGECVGKAIVPGTVSKAHPDSRRPQVIDLCAPEETRSSQGGIPATVFQGQTVHRQGHR